MVLQYDVICISKYYFQSLESYSWVKIQFTISKFKMRNVGIRITKHKIRSGIKKFNILKHTSLIKKDVFQIKKTNVSLDIEFE